MPKRKCHTSKVGRGGKKSYYKAGRKKQKYSFELELESEVIFEHNDQILLGRVKTKVAESKYTIQPVEGGLSEIIVTWQNHPRPVNDAKITSSEDIEVGDVVLVQHSMDMGFAVWVPSTAVEIHANHIWVKPENNHSKLCIKVAVSNAFHPRKAYKLNTNIDSNISPSDVNIVSQHFQTEQI